jgi:organic hydroperoxide reductase OsmC/OhrA
MAQQTMTQLKKVLYTATAHTTSGGDGASHSDDGRLDVTLSTPGNPGTAPSPKETIHLRPRSFFLEGE